MIEKKGVEKRYDSSKAQNMLNEYGDFLREVMNDIIAEYNAPINGDDVGKIGLEYARRLEGKNSMKKLMQKINTIAGKHE